MLQSFQGVVYKSVLPMMVVGIAVIVAVSIYLPYETRRKSLLISQPTTYNILLQQMKIGTQGLAFELDSQTMELSQHLRLMANETDQLRPIAQPLNRRILARFNNESNAVPLVDGDQIPTVGAFFQPGVTVPSQLAAHPYIAETENAIMAFRPILKSTPEVSQVYIGFLDDLIFWLERTYHRADNYVSATFMNFCTGKRQVGYLSHCDLWSILAFANPGTVVFVPPVVDDDTGQLVLSLSLTLQNIPGAAMGMDRDMTQMDLAVKGDPSSLTFNGYRILVHKNGNVITHPLFTNRTQTKRIELLEPNTSLNWTQLLINPPADAIFTRADGVEWVITANQVSTPGWVVCTLAPLSDLTAKGDKLSAQHTKLTNIGLSVMIPMSVLMIVYLIVHSAKASAPVAERLKSFHGGLSNVMSANRKQFIEHDMTRPTRRPDRPVAPATDLQGIEEAVDQVLAAVRINMADKVPRTLSSQVNFLRLIDEAIEIARPSKKTQRFLGVCLLKKSLLISDLAKHWPECGKTLEDAEAPLVESCRIAQQLEQRPDALECDKLAASSRPGNLALLLSDLKRYDSAYDEFAKCIKKHRELENASGYVPAYINTARAILLERKVEPPPNYASALVSGGLLHTDSPPAFGDTAPDLANVLGGSGIVITPVYASAPIVTAIELIPLKHKSSGMIQIAPAPIAASANQHLPDAPPAFFAME